jgi:putative copper export protein
MLIYLPCVSALITYYIFNSKGIDYRAVGLGALLPISIDLVLGGVSFGHSFLFPVSALVIVMIVTIGRPRMLRRRLLCVVIGIFMALVLEGTFINESTWWWPLGLRNQADKFSLLPRNSGLSEM